MHVGESPFFLFFYVPPVWLNNTYNFGLFPAFVFFSLSNQKSEAEIFRSIYWSYDLNLTPVRIINAAVTFLVYNSVTIFKSIAVFSRQCCYGDELDSVFIGTQIKKKTEDWKSENSPVFQRV